MGGCQCAHDLGNLTGGVANSCSLLSPQAEQDTVYKHTLDRPLIASQVSLGLARRRQQNASVLRCCPFLEAGEGRSGRFQPKKGVCVCISGRVRLCIPDREINQFG